MDDFVYLLNQNGIDAVIEYILFEVVSVELIESPWVVDLFDRTALLSDSVQLVVWQIAERHLPRLDNQQIVGDDFMHREVDLNRRTA